MRLIEDLHTQLLASGRTKSALEMDLASSQKSLHRLAQDNQDLRAQLDQVHRELQRVREGQTETAYLREENEDALEKIRNSQQEVRSLREALARMNQEKEEALGRVRQMESEEQQSELLRIKERLREREASHFSRENQELQARLEAVMAENAELEEKYETLRKSFSEVKESLAVLRDSFKASYYKTSDAPS
jgi:chromosome segregation ATPase